MDHFRQIPMFGGAWHDMLESYTTLAFLAGVTERVRLGTLVTASPTATSPTSGRSSPPSTCSRAGGRRAASGSAGSQTSTAPTAGRSRRPRRAVRRCSRTRSSSCPCCGARARRPSRDRRSRCPRRCAIRARSRSGSRSSSAATASAGRCGWRRSTPTPATSSATSTSSPARSAALRAHCAALGPRSRRGRGHPAVDHARRSRRAPRCRALVERLRPRKRRAPSATRRR